MKNNVTAIILAGGKSSRMGTDKGLVLIKGKHMVEYVIDAVKSCCDEMLIISNQNGYDGFGVKVLKDDIENIGPIGGIYTGLNHSKNNINIVLTCDSPFVDATLISEMLNSYNNDMDVLFLAHQNLIYPLTAIYNKRILKNIKSHIEKGEYKVRTLFKTVNSQKMNLSNINSLKVQNINTQEDLKKHI